MLSSFNAKLRKGGRKPLHRYALFLVASIVLLIFFGGQVKSTNSGLSVPDWPNTYGHFMFAFPWEKMVGGIFWEHTHRMIASVVGLLTFVLTWWVYVVDDRRWVKRLAMIASIAVVLQGVLGGLTVRYMLPVAISASHGTLAQIYFCMVVLIALATSAGWPDAPRSLPEEGRGPSLRRLTLWTTGLIFAQLVVGAIMRHSEAGLVIPDVPTMFGSWIPPLSDERIAAANSELWKMNLLWKVGLTEVTRWHMVAHLLHRVVALVVSTMIVWTMIRVYRDHATTTELKRPAALLLAFVIVQVTLGVLTILTEKQYTITTLHVVTGALTLATSLVLTVRAHRLLAPARQERRVLMTKAKEVEEAVV